MISRVAESCFWLLRYVERADNLARLLQVTHGVVLDVDVPPATAWPPVLAMSGEEARFVAQHGRRALADGARIEDFLSWDAANPVALINAIRWARENARTIRETVSLEMWQSLNAIWLWLDGGQGARLYERDRHAFYERIKQGCQLFHGLCHTTMLHEEPFDFMRAGALLERAEQVTRMLHAAAGLDTSAERTAAVSARWLATLRSAAAVEGFAKRTDGALTGPAVVEFLLFDEHSPRSAAHCLERLQHFLLRIRQSERAPVGREAGEAVDATLAWLRARSMETLLVNGLVPSLTFLLERLDAIGRAVEQDFFRPGTTMVAA